MSIRPNDPTPLFCKAMTMGKYCDTKILEMNWYDWLVASAVPALEKYRKLGLLWTKVAGEVTDKNGKPVEREGVRLSNPCFPLRMHYLALASPVHFTSYNTAVNDYGIITIDGEERTILLKEVDQHLNLESDNKLHQLDQPFKIQTDVIPYISQLGYRIDRPTNQSWHAILEDVNKMCLGISTKFNPSSPDEHMELAQEAFLQVTKKLTAKKLVYTPGRAPVFNLLTTTIYRCMYSIKNRAKNQRNGFSKLVGQIQGGSMPLSLRSYKMAYSQGKYKS